MIKLFLIAIAAILNATMDLLENENFSRSIFRNLNPKFWYKRESWKYAYRIAGYKFDAWHLCKSGMIICICASAALPVVFVNIFSDICIYGAVWIIVFNLFYNHIWISSR